MLPDDETHIDSSSACPASRSSLMTDLRMREDQGDSIDEWVIAIVVSSLNALNLRSVTWDRVRTATAIDTDMLPLTESEHRHQLPESLRDYFQYRKSLSTVDGVI
ncbi:hypothetical protein DPMN_001049 [Dreissena polymorpha]|uniref:Uncharacterized protein n=1 Tax=Dreissena polymorpha TaxID=45954 RepID=A0A9D4MH23_DREPO|nr:hypothetical protein DPMN_001049 [Dreissena polymorpha]